MRLASVYAVLDKSLEISLAHLEAAFALWRYSEDSARYIFGEALGDPVADTILQALRSAPDGLTQTEISNHLGHNVPAAQIGRALGALDELDLARRETEPKGGPGRPAVRWRAVRVSSSSSFPS
jgi:hypothetical protein